MAATIFVSSAGASHAQVVSEPEIIAYAHGETPSFFAMTPAKVGLIGGLLGAAVMYATGAELIKKTAYPIHRRIWRAIWPRILLNGAWRAAPRSQS